MFVFYLVILNIVFSGHYLYCGNCCESCKCCCCSRIGPNGPGNPKGKPKNDVKVLQSSTSDYDTLRREFRLQNYSFLQRKNACWLSSYLLSVFNIPLFQNFIKNYIYDGKQEHYYLKIIQDLFNDMQTKQGVYDVDFNKYYSRFIKDGEINHKEFYKPQDHGGFSGDPSLMSGYILKDILFWASEFSMVLHLPVATNLLFNDVSFKKQLNEFLQYLPPLYILNIVLNNIISNYLLKNGPPKFNIADSDDQNLKNIYMVPCESIFFVPKRGDDDWLKTGVPPEGRYRSLVLLAEKDIVAEFKELRRYFLKEGYKFFESSKNGSMDDFFAEIKQKMDRYTYELNAVICGGGHFISVVRDNKNNKTYDLQTCYKAGGPKFSREIPNDFLDPEKLCFRADTICEKCKQGNCNSNHYYPACVFFVSAYRKNN